MQLGLVAATGEEAEVQIDSNTILWADQPMARKYGTEHFLVAGASGSGKTTIINNLLKSVCRGPLRGIVYDPKQEILPLLFWLRGETKESIAAGGQSIKVLHPLDTRCCAWDMAKDIDGPISARQVSTILVPDSNLAHSAESFFTEATRDLLTGVFLSFIACVPNVGTWTFRDVILAMLYEPYLRHILDFRTTRDGQPFPTLSRLRASYLDSEDKRTVANVRSSVNTRLSVYEPIAAAWHKAILTNRNRTFSLNEWMQKGRSQILVLGNDETARVSIDSINQAIFKRATDYILAQPEIDQTEETGINQVWVFLDEVRMAGKLDGLSRLMTTGRSKGACVVLGFQDISGLNSVYGEDVANEIIAQCNNVAVMRLNSPDTAQWASSLFGKRKLMSENRGVNFGGEGNMQISRGSSEHELPYVFSADFTYLPTPPAEKAVTGYIKSPANNPAQGLDQIKFRVTKAADSVGNPSRPQGVFLPFLPSDPSAHYLLPWNQDDWDRLGFKEPFVDLQETATSNPVVEQSVTYEAGTTVRETMLKRIRKS